MVFDAKALLKVIAAKMEGRRHADYCIGIAADPARQFEEYGKPPSWQQWEVDGPRAAVEVKNHFLRLGMQPCPDEWEGTKYVYVFPARQNKR